MRVLLGLVWIVMAGCGRLGFGDRQSGEGGADAAAIVANRVFVTSSVHDGNLGGLAGADAICNSAASAAGLDGTYVAWLSTTTVDAITRLAGARGWVRVDGAPVADLAADLTDGKMLNPIDHDEYGLQVANTAQVGYPWTGTGQAGTYFAGSGSCSDWTNGTLSNGASGYVSGGWLKFTLSGGYSCNTQLPLYCFEIDRSVAVVPQISSTDAIAFVSSSPYAGGGVGALDALCQTDAAAAGLSGTFLAAVATTSSTIASRFDPAVGWRRIDGVPLAPVGHLLDGSDPWSFATQHADGTYITMSIATGATSPASKSTSDCSEWTATSGNATAGWSYDVQSSLFWGIDSVNCGPGTAFLCLQHP